MEDIGSTLKKYIHTLWNYLRKVKVKPNGNNLSKASKTVGKSVSQHIISVSIFPGLEGLFYSSEVTPFHEIL